VAHGAMLLINLGPGNQVDVIRRALAAPGAATLFRYACTPSRASLFSKGMGGATWPLARAPTRSRKNMLTLPPTAASNKIHSTTPFGSCLLSPLPFGPSCLAVRNPTLDARVVYVFSALSAIPCNFDRSQKYTPSSTLRDLPAAPPAPSWFLPAARIMVFFSSQKPSLSRGRI